MRIGSVLLVLFLCGCVSLSVEKNGTKVNYSSMFKNYKGVTLDTTETGVRASVESTQSETQALSSAVDKLSTLAGKSAQ